MILVALNAGSSTIKYAIFDVTGGEPTLRARAVLEGSNADVALTELSGKLGEAPAAVAHRVVHGGADYSASVKVDDAVRAALLALVPMAPLHQPASLACLDAARGAFPDSVHVACFDTAFHRTHPEVADWFALPREEHARGIRRYGFHGLSYANVARQFPEGRVVCLHLGNGASACAMRDGKSQASSMSFSVLDGLPMGTRPGQLDAGVVLHWLREGRTPEVIERVLYKESGLRGLSGTSSDMRALLASKAPEAAFAVEYFVHYLVREVGAMAAALGGVDTLVFTGGIGEHAAVIRERVVRALGWLGFELDEAANAAHARRITTAGSARRACIVEADEEAVMVREALGLL